MASADDDSGDETAMLADVIVTVSEVIPPNIRHVINADTRLVGGDLDLDSLLMLELVERLRDAYGVDFLGAHYSIRDMITPRHIVATICKSRFKKK